MRNLSKLDIGASVRVTAQVYEFGKNGVMIDRRLLEDSLKGEEDRFIRTHKCSGDLPNDANSSMLLGVPMARMTRWPGAHSIFVDCAEYLFGPPPRNGAHTAVLTAGLEEIVARS